ncbi:uncharacterized protein LOC101863164 [Aplysia californica]|uniref:Uncharacterized protein LOC101863164 n=1 Tax=Aplysia californica TaxID=6500 RepID=A0ABM0KBI1_APLCA|nr:uncharacterized protein LOC101863164 [Aplysia californica]
MASSDQLKSLPSQRKLIWENYNEQKTQHWPARGRHILAHYDDEGIVVYQAFNKAIAEYAVKFQRFGGPAYRFERMSWIKTNFMWMMYRCGWASKPNQEHVLAIRISRAAFEDILSKALTMEKQKEQSVSADKLQVRLQWDPDHNPQGGPAASRRAIQLGLKGQILKEFSETSILNIMDITEQVREQRRVLDTQGEDAIVSPRERIYLPASQDTARQIGLDDFSDEQKE